MKRFLALMLTAASILSLCACSKAPSYERPVSFYYPVSEMQYDATGSAISPEVREGKDLTSLESTLELYLNGPQDSAYTDPFPQGLRIQDIDSIESTLYLTFSDELGKLSGMDLTVACCCITLTCLELTNASNIFIQAESVLLGGEKSITMNRDCLLLLDNSGEAND